MKLIVVVPAAALAAWALVPIVDIAIRGTIDSRTRAALRAESVLEPTPAVDLPGPRSSPEHGRATTAARHSR